MTQWWLSWSKQWWANSDNDNNDGCGGDCGEGGGGDDNGSDGRRFLPKLSDPRLVEQISEAHKYHSLCLLKYPSIQSNIRGLVEQISEAHWLCLLNYPSTQSNIWGPVEQISEVHKHIIKYPSIQSNGAQLRWPVLSLNTFDKKIFPPTKINVLEMFCSIQSTDQLNSETGMLVVNKSFLVDTDDKV